ITVIVMLSVPDLGGFPPSTAVKSSLYVVVISLSTAFFSTKNGILSSSLSL
uniref:Uncharacterized protein n=1 Tax=Sinocyclocheilus rhinocerous TaxID=307959 RepID=A0A673KSW7_9TELE